MFATSNKCIASNKCLTSSNKKLVETMFATSNYMQILKSLMSIHCRKMLRDGRYENVCCPPYPTLKTTKTVIINLQKYVLLNNFGTLGPFCLSLQVGPSGPSSPIFASAAWVALRLNAGTSTRGLDAGAIGAWPRKRWARVDKSRHRHRRR